MSDTRHSPHGKAIDSKHVLCRVLRYIHTTSFCRVPNSTLAKNRVTDDALTAVTTICRGWHTAKFAMSHELHSANHILPWAKSGAHGKLGSFVVCFMLDTRQTWKLCRVFWLLLSATTEPLPCVLVPALSKTVPPRSLIIPALFAECYCIDTRQSV